MRGPTARWIEFAEQACAGAELVGPGFGGGDVVVEAAAGELDARVLGVEALKALGEGFEIGQGGGHERNVREI
ncbi:MAG TPA: hypothetical protein VD997_01410 [Phycisphaerales bacterium]|nr:hypothetical protein [Phycisphaerales bacterium]